MADTCIWTGQSGKQYTFHVHSLPISFKANQGGNYIFAKIVDKAWTPIYIGEGDLADRISDKHHKAECIATKGATDVHERLNSSEADRKRIEEDLLANYTQAYAPTGCNEKEGG